MILKLINKDTLIIDEFKFKCCIGKNGLKTSRIEGDKCTPKGKFELGTLYWRKDRINKIETNLNKKKIKKNMYWCNDINNSNYNKEITNRRIKSEKLFRKDNKYDCLILIKYNYNRPIKNKGSAIFLHLTKDYRKTAGCVAVNKKDFFIIAKILTKKSRILI